MSTAQSAAVPEAVLKDIANFKAKTDENEMGLFSDTEYKPFRLSHGVYGQRQENVQMLRIKVPGGQMTTAQLRAFGSLARDEAPMGVGHVTTRSAIQLHYVPLVRVEGIMRYLAENDLTSREACGNAVRNITGSPVAGLDASEAFDAYPYNLALFRRLLRRPEFGTLPRKFKIAVNGGERDFAQAAINDVGLFGKVQVIDGKPVRGFKVKVGGGLGSSPQDAWLYSDFIPEDELIPHIEAILTHFNEKGNRKNRMAARLKYLIRKEGFDVFKEEVEAIRAKGPQKVPFEFETLPENPAADADAKLVEEGSEDYKAWLHANTWPQQQPGYRYSIVKLTLGDITWKQFFQLADIADKYGNGTVRTSNDQNMILPWLKIDKLDQAYADLKEAGLADLGPDLIGDVTSCPGADTCNLGLTASKALGEVLTGHLSFGEGKNEDLKGSHIKISGCPNSCGQHHVGTLGFFGQVRKVDGKDSPQFNVLIGGGINEEGAKFGRLVGRVPSLRIQAVVDALVGEFRAKREGEESFEAFLQRLDEARAKEIVEPFAEVTSGSEDIFYDNLSDEEFVLEGMGESECV